MKSSIIYDTLPKVMETCFPQLVSRCKLNKSDWYYEFPNGSQIWFGGLDDKERTEKILGNEYATVFLNECSQIPWASRTLLVTRLAQKTDLRLRAYYDCNPPNAGHWTHKLFIQKRSPDTRERLLNPDNFTSYGPMNPVDNKENIAPEYLAELDQLPARQRKRFRDGLFGDDGSNALWTLELIDQQRMSPEDLPDMLRVVVAVDPSGASGEEDERSDEIGIIVCGLGMDGKGYVLDDVSGKLGPRQWGQTVVNTFHNHEADRVVAETNYGGAMVKEIIKSNDPNIPFTEVRASRGKIVRAEPIADLFEQQKIMIAGNFPALEDQLCGMTTAGYTGDKSPDRADAMVWAFSQLFARLTRKKPTETGRAPRVVVAYQRAKKYGSRRR